MVINSIFTGNTASALLVTFLFISAVIYFCYLMIKILRGPIAKPLAFKANKYKLIFITLSANVVFNSIIRQIFPRSFEIIDVLTTLGIIISIFFITTIQYYSEELSKNEHSRNFQSFKKKQKA